MAAESLPKRIGDYRIVRRLATEGGERGAEIFLAREEGPMGFSRDVALKRVRTDGADPLQAAALAREARICSKLNHPSIVRIHSFFEEKEHLVLVLDYVAGPALDEVLEWLQEHGEKLGDDASCYLAAQVLNALASAHAMADESGAKTPVLHRGLNPRKVLLARDGSVKLTGFGLGRILDRSPDSAAGYVRGTPGYAAPEQALSDSVTERADVYSAGVLCFHLLVGKRGAENEQLQMMSGKLPSIASVRSDLPMEIAAAIDAALETDPEKRTISCAELARWIEKAAHMDEGKKALIARIEEVCAADEDAEAPPSELARRPQRRKERVLRKRLRASSAMARVAAKAMSSGPDSAMTVQSSEVRSVPLLALDDDMGEAATAAALPKVDPDAPTGTTLPKIDPDAPTGAALPKIDTDAPTATAMPKVEMPKDPPPAGAPAKMPGPRAQTMIGMGIDRNAPIRARRPGDAPHPPNAPAKIPTPHPVNAPPRPPAHVPMPPGAPAALLAGSTQPSAPQAAPTTPASPAVPTPPPTPVAPPVPVEMPVPAAKVIIEPPAATEPPHASSSQQLPRVPTPTPIEAAPPEAPVFHPAADWRSPDASPFSPASLPPPPTERKKNKTAMFVVVGVVGLAGLILVVALIVNALKKKDSSVATKSSKSTTSKTMEGDEDGPPTKASTEPKPSASTTASAPPSASTKPSASAKPSASTKPSASAPPSASSKPITPATVPLGKPPVGHGWLLVHHAQPGKVFASQKIVGDTEVTNPVPCGARLVVVGKVDEKGKWRAWMSKGQSIYIKCDGTVHEITATK